MSRSLKVNNANSGKAILEKELYSYETIEKLAEEYGSSFYIMNVNTLIENYKQMYHAFKSRYDRFIIGYSYKTNYIPLLCQEMYKLGAYAEVVSRLEYDFAIKIGVDPKKIIFNGPLKSQDDINYALKNESIINLDSFYEIDFVKSYAFNHPNSIVKIGLRVNFDITEDSITQLADGFEMSRFGICEENGDLKRAIDLLESVTNIKIVGLHGHFSTTGRRIESYKRITQELCHFVKKYKLNHIEYIDIGGGISGNVPKSLREYSPTFDEYGEAICAVMNHEFSHYANPPALILEPGISMVGNVFEFVSKVVGIKNIKENCFVLVDGSVHNIKPTFNKKNLPINFLRQHHEEKQVTENFHIVGYTCLEKDYLIYDAVAELPKIGDYILFQNVGAYTIVYNPPFIKERPAIIGIDNQKIFEVRKKETIKQFFNEEIYCFGKQEIRL